MVRSNALFGGLDYPKDIYNGVTHNTRHESYTSISDKLSWKQALQPFG